MGAKWLFASALVGLLSTAAVGAPRPNVVLILVDDMGFSDLGSYGSEIRTPNIDELARTGTRFSNYHTASSCAPTRGMLLTGVDSHRNGVPNIPEALPAAQRQHANYAGVLSPNVATVAELLQDSGYHTYMAGKWHLGHQAEQLPYHRGFEQTVSMAYTGSDNWDQKPYLPIYDDAGWTANGQPLTLPDDYYSSAYLVDKSIEFINANIDDGQPFFAYLPFLALHLPVQAPREFTAGYVGRYNKGWDHLRAERTRRAQQLGVMPAGITLRAMASTPSWLNASDPERWQLVKSMAVYAGMLEALDHNVGRLIAHLKAIGSFHNTVFVVTSDNGAEPSQPIAGGGLMMRAWLSRNGYSTNYDTLGERGSFVEIGPGWASAAVAPLAFYKFTAGEGGMRVPLIISGPQLPQAHLSNAFSFVTDVTPTLLELTQTALPTGRFGGRPVVTPAGRSLLPHLRDPSQSVHPADAAIGFELGGNAALFKGDWKLVRNRPPTDDGRWRLFNIVLDPTETQDMAAARPQLFAQLQQDYHDYAEANGVLEVPAGYIQQQQVVLNALRTQLRAPLLSLGLVLLLLWPLALLWRRN